MTKGIDKSMNELEELVRTVSRLRRESRHPDEILDKVRMLFSSLLNPAVLPPPLLDLQLRSPLRFLLRRTEALTVFAIASPPGFVSSVHDHGSWGLVGQVIGEEIESLYQQKDTTGSMVRLELISTSSLRPGELVTILPPARDLHQVTTISSEPSVSLHAFARDPVQEGFNWFDPRWYEPEMYRGQYDNEEVPPGGTLRDSCP